MNDLSTLSGLSHRQLNLLLKLCNSIISYTIVEGVKNKNQTIQFVYEKNNTIPIDIGFGTLNIKYSDNKILYKFIPSEDLENLIIESYNGKNELMNRVGKHTTYLLEQACKELSI